MQLSEKALAVYAETLDAAPFLAQIEQPALAAYHAIDAAYKNGGKLLVCGNGGSAADAAHIVGELGKRFLLPRPLPGDLAEKLRAQGDIGRRMAEKLHGALRAVDLGANNSLLTASVNDDGAEIMFAQQLCCYGDAGDVLLAISTSGNSANILAAAVTAKAMGIETIAFTGAGGGKLAEICDHALKMPATRVHHIQEQQEVVYHLLCAMLEAERWG